MFAEFITRALNPNYKTAFGELFLQSGLVPDDIVGFEDKAEWMLEYRHKHKKRPIIKALHREYPHFQKANSNEPTSAILEEVVKRVIYNRTDKHIAALNKLVDQNAPVKEIQALTAKHHRDIGILSAAYVTRGFAASEVESKKEYVELRDNPRVIKHPLPWMYATELSGGWEDGEFAAIVAGTFIGKTWIHQSCALASWQNGEKVVYVTKEMSLKQVRKRFEAIFYEVSHTRLKRGKLTPQEETDYLDYHLEEDNDLIIVGDAVDAYAHNGLASLRAHVENYNPDILYIDGAYLIPDDQKGKSIPEQRTHLTNDLRAMASSLNIPIIVTWQLKQDVATDKPPNITDLQWASSAGQDLGTILAVYGVEKAPQRALKFVKKRDDDPGEEILINFCTRDRMDLTQLPDHFQPNNTLYAPNLKQDAAALAEKAFGKKKVS